MQPDQRTPYRTNFLPSIPLTDDKERAWFTDLPPETHARKYFSFFINEYDESWIIPGPAPAQDFSSASNQSDYVVIQVPLGSLASIYPPQISSTTPKVEVDTKTRRFGTLQEAAKVAEAIYYEILAKEVAARELEASYWQYDDETY